MARCWDEIDAVPADPAQDEEQVCRATAPERAPKPTNELPFNRGNSPNRIDEAQRQAAIARGRGPQPDPAAGRPAETPQPNSADAPKIPESQSAMQFPSARPPNTGASGRSPTSGGSLGDALRNLQRYTQGEVFDKVRR